MKVEVELTSTGVLRGHDWKYQESLIGSKNRSLKSYTFLAFHVTKLKAQNQIGVKRILIRYTPLFHYSVPFVQVVLLIKLQ